MTGSNLSLLDMHALHARTNAHTLLTFLLHHMSFQLPKNPNSLISLLLPMTAQQPTNSCAVSQKFFGCDNPWFAVMMSASMHTEKSAPTNTQTGTMHVAHSPCWSEAPALPLSHLSCSQRGRAQTSVCKRLSWD